CRGIPHAAASCCHVSGFGPPFSLAFRVRFLVDLAADFCGTAGSPDPLAVCASIVRGLSTIPLNGCVNSESCLPSCWLIRATSSSRSAFTFSRKPCSSISTSNFATSHLLRWSVSDGIHKYTNAARLLLLRGANEASARD